MKLWLASKWESLDTTFWFLPTLMVIGAIFLSLITIHLDKATIYSNWMATLGWTFTRGPEGSRAVLSTIAGSMMTIASVTFSITIVALQLASSQFGPRLLRNFMRDRGNQIAIGTFIATFTYCLLILRTVNNGPADEDAGFVPHISVTVGLLMSLASLGVLIYFIHHAAESIQAENVIGAVSNDLIHAIDRLYPGSLGRDAESTEPTPIVDEPRLPEEFARDSRLIAAPQSNYLQAIDVDHLLALAVEHDVVISVEQRPGEFFFKGGALARAWPRERIDDDIADAIRGAFYFGSRRTLTQDVEFAIDQIVEVAVRALSPGVNDPFTAINCIDRLGAALCYLTERVIPSHDRHDEQGKLRVMAEASSVEGIINASFHQIRQAARSDASVTIRLLDTIAAVARHTRDPAFCGPLRRQAEAIHRGSQEGLPDPMDRGEAAARYATVIEILDETTREPLS